MRIRSIIALTLLVASQSGAEKHTTFISQSYVDSLVDRAFYIFNSVSDPSSGIPAERAVEYGKQIAAKLREIARDDVNKKYILWRTGELEAQIYLEESGLLMEKEQFRAKESNELVMLYNGEIGKGRPDFHEALGYAWAHENHRCCSGRCHGKINCKKGICTFQRNSFSSRTFS